ncbi:MAG: glutamyl-tRNA reductase [Cyanobacteria bacterium HKST-UBA06]|nr:glutamyl-tRNA reductase [Cyanobacteria bacterium HKST-UBA06]
MPVRPSAFSLNTIVIGVRHANAAIDVREQLAFSGPTLEQACQALTTYRGIEEAAILSTCNRTELYATVSDTALGIQSLKRFLKEYKQFDYDAHHGHGFLLLHEDAIIHLFRVASGIDSMILGEGQILSQIKDALHAAMAGGTAGEIIEKLFKTALTVGKAVRSETGIAHRDPNIPKAALAFIGQQYGQLNGMPTVAQPALVLGAGRIADIMLAELTTARASLGAKPAEITLINRTMDRLAPLAEQYGIQTAAWDQLPVLAACHPLILVATSAKHYLLKPEHFSQHQGQHDTLIMDISVPRNVDPAIGQHPHVKVYNTDDLQGYGSLSEANRLRLTHEANQVIEREYKAFHQWRVGRPAIPVISQLRARIEDARRTEVADFVSYCPETKKSCGVIDAMSRSLVNKLLHDPTIQLRSTPQLDEIYKQAEMLSTMFNIPAPPAACSTTVPAGSIRNTGNTPYPDHETDAAPSGSPSSDAADMVSVNPRP